MYFPNPVNPSVSLLGNPCFTPTGCGCNWVATECSTTIGSHWMPLPGPNLQPLVVFVVQNHCWTLYFSLGHEGLHLLPYAWEGETPCRYRSHPVTFSASNKPGPTDKRWASKSRPSDAKGQHTTEPRNPGQLIPFLKCVDHLSIALVVLNLAEPFSL